MFYTHMHSHQDIIFMSTYVLAKLDQEAMFLKQEPWFLLSLIYFLIYQQVRVVTILISVTTHFLCLPSSLFFRLGRAAASLHMALPVYTRLYRLLLSFTP